MLPALGFGVASLAFEEASSTSLRECQNGIACDLCGVGNLGVGVERERMFLFIC